VVIATRDRMHGKMMSVIEQLRARKAGLIFVCNEDDEDVCSESAPGCVLAASPTKVGALSSPCTLVRVPHVAGSLQTVVNVVPLHLLSYHLTVLRGHDVDQPRNLAKSATMTKD